MKKLIIPVIVAIVILFAVSFVSARLCKGYDGYYHDCVSYNNYYSQMNYFSGSYGGNTGYDNSIKLNYYENNVQRDYRTQSNDDFIIYIIEGSSNPVYRDTGYQRFTGYGKKSNAGFTIRLANQNTDKWFDSDPYHFLTTRTYNIRSWKQTGEEHCPDGFVCTKGDWF